MCLAPLQYQESLSEDGWVSSELRKAIYSIGPSKYSIRTTEPPELPKRVVSAPHTSTLRVCVAEPSGPSVINEAKADSPTCYTGAVVPTLTEKVCPLPDRFSSIHNVCAYVSSRSRLSDALTYEFFEGRDPKSRIRTSI
ncbi:hypothetical protein PIIN_03219 [Serendipita indica DSM 11827]|uniref:Uncharacterized protein n=1 Tax=Serendipita indica (strain DSM 11827) TaxID=1109443 RepID=G4TDC5_SERID|nr:hypothetical protein PIIN_03219 [Serendipita indica DSM 11827]